MSEFIKKWKDKLDELEEKLNLQSHQVAESFEAQKAKMTSQLSDKIQSLKDTKLDEQTAGLKAKMEALQVQLALGKAESKDAFEAQKKELNKVKAELKALKKD